MAFAMKLWTEINLR